MSSGKTRINSEHAAQQTVVSQDAADLRVCLSIAPMWEAVGDLFSDWINSRTLNDSIALAVFLEHLTQALNVGLIEVQVSGDGPAISTGDKVVVGELRLAGDLDAFRAALKAAHVQVVHAASLAEASK